MIKCDKDYTKYFPQVLYLRPKLYKTYHEKKIWENSFRTKVRVLLNPINNTEKNIASSFTQT